MNFDHVPYHLNSFKCFKKKPLNFKKQKHCFFMDTAKSSGRTVSYRPLTQPIRLRKTLKYEFGPQEKR